jgi:hypothetical protein
MIMVMTILLVGGRSAQAQHRPLLTEDPQPIRPGQVSVETGINYEHRAKFPLSGLEGDLLGIPYLGFSIGLSSIAEFQVDSGFNILFVDTATEAPLADELDFTGDTTTDINDLVIATKILLRRETRRAPAIGFRVATRLPSASNESGLGNDTFDWFLTLLAGKNLGRTRIVGNLGTAVLALPTEAARQNDVLTVALSITHRASRTIDLVAEAGGRVDVKDEAPAGTEDRGQIRLGARFRSDPIRFDVGTIIGMGDDDPEFGLTFGVTYAFDAFEPDK